MTTQASNKLRADVQRGSFHGGGGTLFGISIVNLLLIVATFGVYTFWAKVRVRRYLYSQTEFAGDRFAYHGTGLELFLGALKAFLVLLAFYVVFFLVAFFVSPGLAIALIYAGIAAVIPFAMYGAMRYAMSRTSWRGIRFSFRGRLADCYREYLGGMLLTIVTLGIYTPFFHARMRRYWSNHTYFGNTAFAYDGRGKDFIWHYLAAILLTLPTLGLYWIWYSARQLRYDWSHTTFASGRFACTISGGAILWLVFSNLLLLIATLGFALPWIRIRSLRFVLERVALQGEVAWAKIVADGRAQKVGTTGEGLADALDVGFAV